MRRDVRESRTTDNSIEAAVLSKREAFEAYCERVLNIPNEHKPSLQDLTEFERLLNECLTEDDSELTIFAIRMISELLFKRQEVLSLQLRLQIVEVLSQKLRDVVDLEDDVKLSTDAQEMIIGSLQLLWLLTTISFQVNCKAVDSLAIDTLLELMQRTESFDIKRLAMKLISIVNKARNSKTEEHNAKLLNCVCDVLTSDSELSLKLSAVEMIDAGEVPCLNLDAPSDDTLWKNSLKALVSYTNKLPETPNEDSTNTETKEWELLAATLHKLAAFVASNSVIAYTSLSSGFVLKIDSWLRTQDVHLSCLFGQSNCRLASFMKQLESLLKVEGIQACDNPSTEELTSLLFTNNTDPDQISISRVDDFWKYPCCIKFHCAWLAMLEALASHAVIANALIAASLHKCWIKYLTELLLGIENNLHLDKSNSVALLQLKSACVRLLTRIASKVEFANEIIKQHQILDSILPIITSSHTESVILAFHKARLLSELLRKVSRSRRDTNKHFLYLIKTLESIEVNLSSNEQTSIDKKEFGTVLRQLYVLQEEMKTDAITIDSTPLTLNLWHALDQPQDIQINFSH